MKLFKNKIMMLLALTAISFSCEDFLGGDLNQDPNKPSVVPISGILPQIQISLADTYGGSFSRWNCMFVQQVEGVARQWSAFNQYQIQPVRFDDAWSDYYENVLVELQPIKQEALDNGYNHYLGIMKTIEAFMLMTAVDVWGDIPYSEAVQGEGNFNPVFDQDTDVYAAVLDLLNGTDGALALFGRESGLIFPGSDDLYYGGTIEAWTKAVNAMLARYYLHTGDYTQALNFAENSFESRSDNMSYQYGSPPDGGQWYRFNDGRTGDIEFHPTMRLLMTGLNDDDRLSIIDNEFTTTGHPYFISAFTQDLISYREIQFIIAECLQRTGGSAADLRAAYLNGIEASFEEFGFDGSGSEYSSYVGQAIIDPGEGNITLDLIMTQKYIAQFAQPEVFSDWRRTGIPALTPVSGTQVPRRWNYGFNSILFNSNAPSETDFDLFTPRVFWDN